MRVIFLCVFAALLAGVDRDDATKEIIVLQDGRTFTGWYDDDQQAVIIDTPRAQLKIPATQIASRTPVTPKIARPIDEIHREVITATSPRTLDLEAERKALADAQEQQAEARRVDAERVAAALADRERLAEAERKAIRDQAHVRARFYRTHWGLTFDPLTMTADQMDAAAEPIMAEREPNQAAAEFEEQKARERRAAQAQAAADAKAADKRRHDEVQRQSEMAYSERLKADAIAREREKDRIALIRSILVLVLGFAFILAPVWIARIRKSAYYRHIAMISAVAFIGTTVAALLTTGEIALQIIRAAYVIAVIILLAWACWPKPKTP